MRIIKTLENVVQLRYMLIENVQQKHTILIKIIIMFSSESRCVQMYKDQHPCTTRSFPYLSPSDEPFGRVTLGQRFPTKAQCVHEKLKSDS